MIRLIAFILVFVGLVLSAVADQSHPHPDELSAQQFGTVHFPTSCAPGVQKDFERGVALLHSFAFESAEAAFRQVAAQDPHCAMAYWGIAKTSKRWGEPDSNQLKHGWQAIQKAASLSAKTPRERDYISAVADFYRHPEKTNEKRDENYLKGMERLYQHFPEDHEAAAFYALALENSDRDDDPTHARRKEAAAILEGLFVLEPNHPGVAHYLIHTYDYPGMAELGLPAARRYAKIAPTAPHALHMPSHIFARLGMWPEDIDSNLTSIAASRHAGATHMGDEGHQYHAMEFLVYAYLQSGRESEAEHVIEQVKTLPKMKNMYGTDYDPKVSALVEYSASFVTELHRWRDAVALPLLTAEDDPDSSLTYKARGTGAARLGDLQTAKLQLRALDDLHAKLLERKKTSPAKAVDEDRRVVQAWIDHAEGKNDEALTLLREMASKDKGLFATDGDIPAHEMLGDMLLELHQPEHALAEFEAELKVSPKRFNSLYGAGQAAESAKDYGKAETYYWQLLQMCAGGNSSRAELAHAQGYLSTLAFEH
jgi:hypothetical protein